MSRASVRMVAMVLTVLAGTVACRAGSGAAVPGPVADEVRATAPGKETAVVAGGCFWGIQAVFQHVKGVVSATSGVFERSHHVRQGVQLPQALRLDARPRQFNDAAGRIEVFNRGVDGFLRVKHLRQAVKPRIRHADHAHARLGLSPAMPGGVRPGKDFEQRCLSNLGQAHDADS